MRETGERERDGAIPGALHAPFPSLASALGAGGSLNEAARSGRQLLFYCAGGPRSARAVLAAHASGFADACHLCGGITAWREAGDPIERIAAGA